VIPKFDARIVVHENATLEVTERIEYDFGENQKHGIYRNIPYSYQAGTETYTADIASVLVTDEFGEAYLFVESRGDGELSLKVGDPEKLISGKKVYVISYIVTGPFLYFDEYDELYWNVTGFWEKPIGDASVLVDLPLGATVLSASCYKGVDGSQTPCDEDERLVNVERAGYTAKAHDLKEHEGLTVAVSFPKGLITQEEKPWAQKKTPLEKYWSFIIPFLVVLFLFSKWRKEGKDPEGKSAIVTQFSPPQNISPALAGVLYTEKVTGKEISAEIVRLAVEGFLKIHRFEKKILLFSTTDYLLERANEVVPSDALGARILEILFKPEFIGEEEIQGMKKQGVVLSKMKHKFVEEKKEIDTKVYEEVTSRGYFKGRPDSIRQRYLLTGFLVLIFGFMTSAFFSEVLSFISLPLAMVGVSGILVFVFGFFMPVRTAAGVAERDYLEGFERYLSVAEKDRIDFHSSPLKDAHEPEKTMTLFDACLPYAIIFGVEEKWAEQFKDIYLEEPHWYEGGQGNTFGIGAFTSELSDFSKSMTVASVPQSSGSRGSGHSGGGFGGGGGGSW